jgi:methylmalonyl-CoA mutase
MADLFKAFSSVTKAQWKEQIIKDLKGIDFESLIWKTHNGFNVNPFYTSEDLKEQNPPLFHKTGWDSCELIFVWDEKEANTRALKALANGASGLSFIIHKKTDTATLIKGISLEHIYSQFFITNDALHILEDLKKYYGKVNPHDGKVKCFVNIDPLSMYLFWGEWHVDQQKDLSVLKELKHIPVNVGMYEEAGAGTVNELAIGLAHTNEYFNYLQEQDQLKDRSLHFMFSVAPDFFTEIAKFRAWRKLISLLQEQYKTNFPIHIHAQTAQIDKSSMDAYTNMLRTTTEGMSAIIGGVDSLCVLPFNEGFEKASEFASRISLNQQHILKDESYLDKVADISAGSYYIESLTDAIAEKAWEQFKLIESKGGFIACTKNDFIQDCIKHDAESLRQEAKEGKLILVGVNKYQDPKEKFEPRPEPLSKDPAKKLITPVKPIRLAELFEKERNKQNA